MNIKFLPAFSGDCILVQHKNKQQNINILIDGGIARTYPQSLKNVLKEKIDNKEKIDLLIITHVDDDHIGGIIKLFEDSNLNKSIIKNVWFNSGENISNYFETRIKKNRNITIIPDSTREMSIKDGISLESELKYLNLLNAEIIQSGNQYDIGDISINILSPTSDSLSKLNKRWTREVNKTRKMSNPITNKYQIELNKLNSLPFKGDNSIPNETSIAFLLKVQDKKVLLLGDSHQSTIINSLKDLGYSTTNQLTIDLIKLSHHGSKKNTGYELLKMIKCKNYVISTDGNSHNLPSKEVFARILEIHNNSTFFFNYKNEITTKIFTKQDTTDYNFTCKYLSDSNYVIDL